MQRDIIELAIRRGWKVFPYIRQRSPAGQPFLWQATSSEEQVEKWFPMFGNRPWAIATGEEFDILPIELFGDSGIQWMVSSFPRNPTEITNLIHTDSRVTLLFRWPKSRLSACVDEWITEGVYVPVTRGFVQLGNFDEDKPVSETPCWLLNLIDPSRQDKRKRVA